MQAFASVAYFFFLLALGCLGIFYLTVEEKLKRYSALLIALFSVNFLVRGYLILINETFSIFAPKLAGELSIEAFNAIWRGTGDSMQATFVPQMVVNFFAFSFFGAERFNVIVTNAFLVSLAGPIIFVTLRSLWNWKVAITGLLASYLYLGALNFSLFGLRDPVIYFFVIVYVLSVLRLVKSSSLATRLLYLCVATIAVAFVLYSRAELLPIVSVLPALLAFNKLAGMIRRFHSKAARALLLLTLLSVTTVSFGFLTLLTYRIVLAQVHIYNLVSPLEIAGYYADARYQRQFNDLTDGGGAILAPAIYSRIPPLLRVPIQATGIIVLPFPWYINSVNELLAFIDSLFIIFCIFVAFRRYPFLEGDRKLVFALLASYFVGVLIMGFIVNNTGNALRMRLSLFPFLLLAFAIASSAVSSKDIASNDVNSKDKEHALLALS